MKTLGLLGGSSWVSTVEYYRLLNQGVNAALGGTNAAQCLLYSFNFADLQKTFEANDWEATFQLLLAAAEKVKVGGAEGIVLCANTLHFAADRLEQAIGLPLIHIATVTAAAIRVEGLTRVGRLGTRFTMERNFFKERLRAQGIETLLPAEEDRAYVHATIFDELGRGLFPAATKQRYLGIIDQLVAAGAQGIVLGSAELPLLLQPEDLPVPGFDTTQLHAAVAVAFNLSRTFSNAQPHLHGRSVADVAAELSSGAGRATPSPEPRRAQPGPGRAART